MKRLYDVLALLGDACDEALLRQFIHEQWVVPELDNGDWLFEDIDVARCHLILHLRLEMQVDDAAMPLVLHLLDQVYGLRRQLRSLATAIEKQPRRVQADIFSLLKEMER